MNNQSAIIFICFLRRYLLLQVLAVTFVTHACAQPIAYYNFDNNTDDKSGNGNNGMIVGSVTKTTDRFGNPCGAMQFDGQTGYIEVPNSASLRSPSRALTISVWYKLTNTSKPGKWLTVICKGSGSNEIQNPQYRLQVQQTPGLISAICSNSVGSSTISINTAFTKCDNDFIYHPFETEKWCFYTVTYDGWKVCAYMNAVKVFEQFFSDPLIVNQDPLHIGKDDPGSQEFFKGSLDDLRIYDHALSEKEITDLYGEGQSAFMGNTIVGFVPPSNITLYVPAASCSAIASFSVPVAHDPCGPLTVIQTAGPTSGSRLHCGKYRVSYQAISGDAVESCSFYLSVIDTIAPILHLPKDVILTTVNNTAVKYRYDVPWATDNCGIRPCVLVSGKSSESYFDVGKNEVRYKAIDSANNTVYGSFYITVRNNDKSIITTTVKQKDTQQVTGRDTPVIVVNHNNRPTVKNNGREPDAGEINGSAPFAKTDTGTNQQVTDTLRQKQTQRTIDVDSQSLQIDLYDNAEIDGDSVTIILNRKIIASHVLLGVQPVTIKISIDTTIDNELTMYAENLGSIPPNTALLVLMDGVERYEIHLSSNLQTNGTLLIRKRKR
jgi:hypothetical protein